MGDTIKKKGKIELGLPEFEPDLMFKQQITDNLTNIHAAILGMDGNYSPNFDFLVDCLITAITPFEKQDAMFQLKKELIQEYTDAADTKSEENVAIMRANMRILGLCREHFARKYMETRVSVMV